MILEDNVKTENEDNLKNLDHIKHEKGARP